MTSPSFENYFLFHLGIELTVHGLAPNAATTLASVAVVVSQRSCMCSLGIQIPTAIGKSAASALTTKLELHPLAATREDLF